MRGCVVCVRCVAEVNASNVQVREAANYRGQAEDETDAEADEVEGVHSH